MKKYLLHFLLLFGGAVIGAFVYSTHMQNILLKKEVSILKEQANITGNQDQTPIIQKPSNATNNIEKQTQPVPNISSTTNTTATKTTSLSELLGIDKQQEESIQNSACEKGYSAARTESAKLAEDKCAGYGSSNGSRNANVELACRKERIEYYYASSDFAKNCSSLSN